MVKRIWFTQQKWLNYLPLRVGLGYLPESALKDNLCRKIYTTRTHPLSGEYIVVEGSRFKAKPVKPEIRFRVETIWLLDINEGLDCPVYDPDYELWAALEVLTRNGLSFPELDIGIRGTTYAQFKDIIHKLNSRAAATKYYYINLLEAII